MDAMRASHALAAALLILALTAPAAAADREVAEATTLAREASLDEATALAAMAVAAHTGEAVGYEDLASGVVLRAHALDVAEERAGLDIADLNVENAFSALALGLVDRDPDSDIEALAASANLTQQSAEVELVERTVRLPPRTAVYAIALANAGGALDLASLLQVEQTVVERATAAHGVDIGTGNALLALTLGYGGEGVR